MYHIIRLCTHEKKIVPEIVPYLPGSGYVHTVRDRFFSISKVLWYIVNKN